MTVDALSIEAYRSLGKTEDSQRAIILETIRQAMRPSSADLERLTGISRTSVCARLRKLEKDGLICKGPTPKIDPFTGKRVNWYKVIE